MPPRKRVSLTLGFGLSNEKKVPDLFRTGLKIIRGRFMEGQAGNATAMISYVVMVRVEA